jgi:hypothetical protein
MKANDRVYLRLQGASLSQAMCADPVGLQPAHRLRHWARPYVRSVERADHAGLSQMRFRKNFFGD